MLTYVSIRPQPIYSRPFRVSSNSGIERSLLLLPRHNHPLQPRLGIIAARPLVENRDPKPAPTIASFAPQPKLPIVDEEIGRQPESPLQEARKILDAAPARTPHDNHFIRRQIAQPQPPIALLLLRIHENKLRTPSPLVHSFRDATLSRAPHVARAAARSRVALPQQRERKAPRP